MAAIRYNVSLEPKIEEEYRLWRATQPRGKSWIDAKGGPYPDGTVYRHFDSAFVDTLERFGIAIERV